MAAVNSSFLSVQPANCHCSLAAYKRYDLPLARLQSPPAYAKTLASVSRRDFGLKKISRSQSVADLGRFANREPYLATQAHMAAVGLKSRALPLNYTTEHKASLRPWSASKLSRSTEHVSRDHFLAGKSGTQLCERSEYKHKYGHRSFFGHDGESTAASCRDFQEAVVPIGHMLRKYVKPNHSMERSTVYKDKYRGPGLADYESKQKRDGFKDLYFSNRNGQLITKPLASISGNTIYKGDYLKPRKGSDLIVPRKHFDQPKKATDLTAGLFSLPGSRPYSPRAANFTSYKKDFVDYHVHHCDCTEPVGPPHVAYSPSKALERRGVALADRLADDRRCTFRNILRSRRPTWTN